MTVRCWVALLGTLALLACSAETPPPEPAPTPNAAGLVRLPCRSAPLLRAAHRRYCDGAGRNWVTPAAQDVMRRAAEKVAAAHPGSAITTMEASWPSGQRPMPPHLSHGDGRQIDVALFYETRAGAPLPGPPTRTGYYAFEPRRAQDPDPCTGKTRPGDNADPPADRDWRLDEGRTRTLIRSLLNDPRVRRLLLEPHLKQRLGFANEERIRFPGCHTLRHDGHVHVDVR